MVAALPLGDAMNSANQPAFVGVYSAQMKRKAELASYQRARVQVLVQNGVVVSPLQTRAVPVTSTTLTQGQRTRTIPVQEMVIALDPDEVAPFLEALSVEAEITCLARSGRPDDPVDSITPSSDPTTSFWGGLQGMPDWRKADPEANFSVIESIEDGERKFVPVPKHEDQTEEEPGS